MSDFDSGDDLFDGIDAEELLSSQTLHAEAKRKREPDINGHSAWPKRPRGHGDDDMVLGEDGSVDGFPDDDPNGPDLANEPARMQIAQNLLTEIFGYKAFRHEQAGVIQRLLAGKNALSIFPTGAGKSLCYQVCLYRRYTSVYMADVPCRYRALLLSDLTWRMAQGHPASMALPL